jgi:hypothetical protein
MDMRKACDIVEWSNLKAIMLKLGFNSAYGRVDYVFGFKSILLGASQWYPTRGSSPLSRYSIGGGDISLYLFLLAGETLFCVPSNIEINLQCSQK